MTFIKLGLIVSPDFAEIFTAELAEIGFDTFEETSDGIHAYIEKPNYVEEDVQEIVHRYHTMTSVQYSVEEVQKENWNKDWEKNYDPIEVEGKCRVRATFHEPDPSFEYEMVVIPKMSFGTGHHATTYNMLRLEMEHDFSGMSVLDVGTGTGILAIMAFKLGADTIECTDIDEWCIENSSENFGLNDIKSVPIHLGELNGIQLKRKRYDVLLANINKNVLLNEMTLYSALIKPKGTLFLSGFYEIDIEDIKNEAAAHNLSVENRVIRDNWAALKLVKY